MGGLSKEDMVTAYNNNLDVIHSIEIGKLIPFKAHPFKLYTGERFKDMVESIKSSSVHIPIIVRPIKDTDTYEILSGHNRVEASKEAGLTAIPTIVHKDLTDDEAMLIVTETNLIQRSFSDLTHSERAVALVTHYEAIKNQGKRTDLINEITYLLDRKENPKIKKDETLYPMDTKSDSKKEIGKKYNMSRATVARYIRVNKLIADLKERLDNGEFPVRAAVEISFLSEKVQNTLNTFLRKNQDCILDMNSSMELRKIYEENNKQLTSEEIKKVLTTANTKTETKSIRIKKDIYNRYFTNQKADDINRILREALEKYFEPQSNSEIECSSEEN